MFLKRRDGTLNLIKPLDLAVNLQETETERNVLNCTMSAISSTQTVGSTTGQMALRPQQGDCKEKNVIEERPID